MKKGYLILAVFGAVIPYAFFDQFFIEYGFALSEFVRQLFSTSPAAGFTADILISSVVFWIWSYRESRLNDIKNWWLYVLLNLSVGLSCAFPLFLFFRHRRFESLRAGHTATNRERAELLAV